MENTSSAPALDYANPFVQKLLSDMDFLRREVRSLTDDKEYLEELLRRALRKRFAPSSETQHHPDQKTLFNEAELEARRDDEEESQTDLVPEYRKKKKRGKPVRKPLPKDLPREIKIIDLPEDKKFCALSGEPLIAMGKEITEQLDFVPAKAVVIETHRLKYVCRCLKCQIKNDAPNGDVQLAPVVQIAELSPQPIPKSMATPALLASIASNKFEFAMPLYRQEDMFRRLKVDLKRSTMGSWMVRCGGLVRPLINLMWDDLLCSPLVFADETPLQIHKGTGKKPTAKSYMWAFMRGGGAGPPIALYEIGPTRAHTVPLGYLRDFEGYLHTDGYGAYETMAAKCPKIILVGDWVHVRRRFDEAIKAQPDPKSPTIKAKIAFDLINELFAIECEMADMDSEKRLEQRQMRSQKIVDNLKAWADEQQSQVPPKSLTGSAISYMLAQWPKLLHFLKDARVGLHTNPIENKIRPFVIGRRNWLFCDTMGGAEASAALYSLIITAKANNLDAFEYLKAVFTEIPKAKTADEIAALLPWNIKLVPAKLE